MFKPISTGESLTAKEDHGELKMDDALTDDNQALYLTIIRSLN